MNLIIRPDGIVGDPILELDVESDVTAVGGDPFVGVLYARFGGRLGVHGAVSPAPIDPRLVLITLHVTMFLFYARASDNQTRLHRHFEQRDKACLIRVVPLLSFLFRAPEPSLL